MLYEFTNRALKSELRKNGIQFYVTFSGNKAAVVEQLNITLKSRMWRYFTLNNTYRYVDVLQEQVAGYNTSPHKDVGMAPLEASDSNQ